MVDLMDVAWKQPGTTRMRMSFVEARHCAVTEQARVGGEDIWHGLHQGDAGRKARRQERERDFHRYACT